MKGSRKDSSDRAVEKHTNSAALTALTIWMYLGCLSPQQINPDSWVLVVLSPSSIVSCHLLLAPCLSFWSGSPPQVFPKHLSKPMWSHTPGWSPNSSPMPNVWWLPFRAIPSSLLWVWGLPLSPFFIKVWLNYNDLIQLSGPKVSVPLFLGRKMQLHANETLRSVVIIKSSSFVLHTNITIRHFPYSCSSLLDNSVTLHKNLKKADTKTFKREKNQVLHTPRFWPWPVEVLRGEQEFWAAFQGMVVTEVKKNI